ncbi:serine protease [Luteitalea sp. TBR-22]|uniref:DNA/RNA non-specific endonuclease n=1 Tax=Luteitalea sp. TBR-22 TaxID=2802971 RepID=UPI001AFC8314|nr:DNA/RNA non-specific endonuclease [Luteitalea sp. TBR-22]BCS33749.1 serine protease [Luteitalea sp. TBR-22]
MSLRERARAVLLADQPIAHELLAMAGRNERPVPAARIGVSMASVRTFVEGEPGWPAEARNAEELDGQIQVEAVVVAHGRPAMLVQRNRIQLPESPELRRRLEATRARFESRLASVGRIELTGHPRLHQAGTAWIVAEHLVVTNAHVAEEFTAREQTHLVFRRAFGQDTMAARVDLREEYVADGATEEFEVGVDQVLYLADLADAQAPDLALLRLSPGSGALPPPIPFADVPLDWGRDVAVVGYPAEDPLGTPSADVARRLFGGIYGVKRFSPGRISAMPTGAWAFSHDATTLGGSSGSAVLDLETGGALGVHFSGTLERANYAVRGGYVLDAITAIRPMVTVPATPPPSPEVPAEPPVVHPAIAGYETRDGYRDDFLGAAVPTAPLPTIVQDADVLEVEWQGRPWREIPYRHFSVVMSRARRLCYVSAVNIDGARSVPHLRRRDWRLDPRIPEARQLEGPVYGNAPRFSRGHMTRREDPAWGETRAEAEEGNADSMHLANAVPQMQPFNAGIWLGLEDYALQNAREDDQKISVFTGPVLRDDDPVFEGVAVPVECWKVIVFVHDETQRLSVSGYLLSQRGFLPHREAVFGAYETFQVPLTTIEQRAGLRFGPLTALDVHAHAPEATVRPLLSPDDIRWR